MREGTGEKRAKAGREAGREAGRGALTVGAIFLTGFFLEAAAFFLREGEALGEEAASARLRSFLTSFSSLYLPEAPLSPWHSMVPSSTRLLKAVV